MKSIVALFVAISLLYVVSSAPTFGTYDCATAKYPIVNSAASAASSYSLAARSGNTGTYEIKNTFNLSGTVTGNVYSPYFTVYTGQTYYIIQGSNSSISVIDTSPALTTCNQTLSAFADEVTRVVNIERGNSTVFRNTYLDQAAAGYISNGALTIPAAYLNYTAPGAATISFIAGTGDLVNPGAIVQSLVDSNVGNASYTPTELGVFYNATAKAIALVFATRNAFCGNGIVDRNETCDDNNVASGDGCSSICQIEAGYTCTQSALQPVSVCTRSGAATSATASSVSASGTSTSTNPAAATSTGATAAASASRSVVTAATGTASTTNTATAASGSGSRAASSTSTSTAATVVASFTSNPATASPSGTFIEPSYATNPTTGSATSLVSWMRILF